MTVDFSLYPDGLVPAIVQDAETGRVLTLGFMNKKALKKTRKEGRVIFYSKSQGQLNTNTETSGKQLKVKEILSDCDGDTLLIKAYPGGKVCRYGTDTCFREKNVSKDSFLKLERLIVSRKDDPRKTSRTSKLFERGVGQIAKKLGEEAVELVIEALDEDDELFREEAADLLYHFLVLLAARDIRFEEIVGILNSRKK